MMPPLHRFHVTLRREIRDPWFWVAIAGAGMVVLGIVAEDLGWVDLAGDLTVALGFLLSVWGVIRSSSRAQVEEGFEGVRGEMRSGFEGVRGELHEVRVDLGDLKVILSDIRDRLPSAPS